VSTSRDYVLLHGGNHGGWCWDFVAAELRQRGHRVAAPDLPIVDPEAGWADHADVALASYQSDDVVLVAHSRSGRLVPQLLERRPVRRVVLISSSILGGTLPPPYSTPPFPPPKAAIDMTRDELGRTILSEEQARSLYFNECSEETIQWALPQLRPQCDPPPLPEIRWPDVPVAYVAGAQDRVVDHDWMRAAAAERLGVELQEIDGDHSPFLSRPHELAVLLHDLANQDARTPTDRRTM